MNWVTDKKFLVGAVVGYVLGGYVVKTVRQALNKVSG